MPTNLAIDDDLIKEAVSIGGHRTKKAAVNCALEEYIQHHKQKKLFNYLVQLNMSLITIIKRTVHAMRGR